MERQCVVLTQYHLPFDKNNNGNQHRPIVAHTTDQGHHNAISVSEQERRDVYSKTQNKFNNVTIKNKSYRSLFEFNRVPSRGDCVVKKSARRHKIVFCLRTVELFFSFRFCSSPLFV